MNMEENHKLEEQNNEMLEESTADPPRSIQAIDKTSVHRICSGQVKILNL